MNLREFVAKLKSPLGKAVLFLGGFVILVLAVIPFLSRDDDKAMVVKKNDEKEKEIIQIKENTKRYVIEGNLNKEKAQSDDKGSPGVVNLAKPEAEKSLLPVDKRPIPPQSGPFVSRGQTPVTPGVRPGMIGTGPGGGPQQNLIMLLDGESEEVEKKAFVSDTYASFGRPIPCQLVNTVESGDTETPLIAVVLKNVWWTNQQTGEKKIIIPVGAEVHGKVNGGKPLRNKITSQGQYVVVWQANTKDVGYELILRGIVLEKSHQAGNESEATINDMSAGLPGEIISNEGMAKMLMYALAFAQGAAQGYQQNSVYANGYNTVVSNDGSTRNALAYGAQNLAQIMLQDISQQIAKESYFIRVPGGTQFYLYVEQVINMDEAKVASTVINEYGKDKKKEEKEKAEAARPGSVLNTFTGGNTPVSIPKSIQPYMSRLNNSN